MSSKWNDDQPRMTREERRRRLDALEAIAIKHPRLVDVEDLLINLIDDTEALCKVNDAARVEAKARGIEPALTHLWHVPMIGPSGATKSTSLKIAMEKINSNAAPGQAPIAYISISESIRSTKALYTEIFRVFGDVNNKDNLETTLSMPNSRDIEAAITSIVRSRGTRVVILDEVHNLLTHDAGKIGRAMSKALKSILNSSVFSLVLAGTEDANTLFKIDDELAGRIYADVNLGKLDHRSADDRMYFFKFVQNYESRLVKAGVLDAKYGFTDDPRSRAKIYEAADGVIGVVVRIAKLAIRRALDASRTTINDDDMADAVTGYRRLNKIARKTNPYIQGPDDDILKYIRAAKEELQPA